MTSHEFVERHRICCLTWLWPNVCEMWGNSVWMNSVDAPIVQRNQFSRALTPVCRLIHQRIPMNDFLRIALCRCHSYKKLYSSWILFGIWCMLMYDSNMQIISNNSFEFICIEWVVWFEFTPSAAVTLTVCHLSVFCNQLKEREKGKGRDVKRDKQTKLVKWKSYPGAVEQRQCAPCKL